MTRQVWGLVLLQWQLFRNGLGVRSAANLVAAFLLAIIGLAVGVAAAAGLYLLARLLPEAGPAARLLYFDGVFAAYAAVCAWGVLIEMQRGDWFDLRRMLLLPVPPRLVVGVNLAISLFEPLPLLLFLATGGLVAGLAASGAAGAGGIALVSACHALALCAWLYWFRGIVAGWLRNPRRRRMLLTAIPIATVAASQAPFLLSQWIGPGLPALRAGAIARLEAARAAWGLGDTPVETILAWAHAPLPALWGALGWWAAVEGRAGLLAGVAAALTGLAAAGAALAHRGALLQAREPVRDAAENAGRAGRRLPLTLRTFPGVAPDTAALAAANFLNYGRHPQMRQLFVIPAITALVLLAALRAGSDAAEAARFPAVPLFLVFWPFFTCSMVIFNQFGMDAGGFRALVLLPIPRHRVFLAKNLALAPYVFGLGIFLAILGMIFFALPPLGVAFLLAHQGAMFLLLCGVGNLVSLWLPHHVRAEAGARPTPRARTALSGLIAMALITAFTLPSLGCLLAAQTYGAIAGAAASAVVIAAAAACYAALITVAGDQFAAREHAVLDALARTRDAAG